VGTYVRAAPEHPFTVRVAVQDGACVAVAEAELNGAPAVVARVAVDLGVMSVKRATIFGHASDGRPVSAIVH
jgi:hypothetical protein